MEVPVDLIGDREVRCTLCDRMLGVHVVVRVLAFEVPGKRRSPRPSNDGLEPVRFAGSHDGVVQKQTMPRPRFSSRLARSAPRIVPSAANITGASVFSSCDGGTAVHRRRAPRVR